MPFIYITGVAGAGKSAVQEALKHQGIHVVDEDDPTIGSAHNKATGQPVKIPPVEERSSDWFDNHEWHVFEAALDDLQKRAATELVVLCGVTLSDSVITDMVDKVVYLKLDETTLRDRLTSRTGNDFGKSAEELEMILIRKEQMDSRFQNNAVIVNATQPLNDVVAAVIDHLYV